MSDPIQRFRQAHQLGPAAVLRLRAECLLKQTDTLVPPLDPDETDRSDRRRT